LLKYVPKRQEFDGDQMDARTTLAVSDHNLSQNQGQKIEAQGQGVYKSTTSFNALCALEPFFIHFFVLAISGAIGSCAHVVTILPSKVC
jgi:hypothetical protein